MPGVVLLLICMEETAYIERLKSLYPAEGEETSNQALAVADEAVRAFPESPKLWCMRGDLIQLGAEDIPHELADALASYERAIASIRSALKHMRRLATSMTQSWMMLRAQSHSFIKRLC